MAEQFFCPECQAPPRMVEALDPTDDTFVLAFFCDCCQHLLFHRGDHLDCYSIKGVEIEYVDGTVEYVEGPIH